ncbi:FUSC family protein [Micrococcales bacterium 31B]|nr:FUSC family protein [Micrococcales bacterium 31B]
MPIVTVKQLLHLGPHNRAHWAALRSSLAVFAPLLILHANNRLDLALYATFGAFTSVYGRSITHTARLVTQAQAAASLVAMVALGALVGLSEARSWIAIPLAAAVATVGCWWADRCGWIPPGPMFLVFAFAGCSSVSTTPALVPLAVGVAAASASLSLALGQVGRGWAWLHRLRFGPDAAYPLSGSPRGHRTQGIHLARYAIAVVVSGLIATSGGIGHPYWAMVGSVVPLAVLDLRHQLARGIHRVVGTLLGVLLTAVLLWIDLRGVLLISVVAVLQGITELVVVRNYGLALLCITPLSLLMVHLAVPTPASVLLLDRSLETIIGVVVGMATAWIFRAPLPQR